LVPIPKGLAKKGGIKGSIFQLISFPGVIPNFLPNLFLEGLWEDYYEGSHCSDWGWLMVGLFLGNGPTGIRVLFGTFRTRTGSLFSIFWAHGGCGRGSPFKLFGFPPQFLTPLTGVYKPFYLSGREHISRPLGNPRCWRPQKGGPGAFLKKRPVFVGLIKTRPPAGWRQPF